MSSEHIAHIVLKTARNLTGRAATGPSFALIRVWAQLARPCRLHTCATKPQRVARLARHAGQIRRRLFHGSTADAGAWQAAAVGRVTARSVVSGLMVRFAWGSCRRRVMPLEAFGWRTYVRYDGGGAKGCATALRSCALRVGIGFAHCSALTAETTRSESGADQAPLAILGETNHDGKTLHTRNSKTAWTLSVVRWIPQRISRVLYEDES